MASRLAVYSTGSEGSVSVLAPRAWKCVGTIGVDGSETLTVSPSGSLKPEQAVTVESIPACQGCIAGLVCSFFPNVLKDWPAMDCKKSPPTELVMHPNATTTFFEDPPGVAGAGNPSGGSYPANGVLIFDQSMGNRTGLRPAAQATCTLPESDHALCTVVLNDFLLLHK
jgi:hypothetical protein